MFGRTKDREPAIASLEASLLPAAEDYIDAYDAAHALRTSKASSRGATQGATGALLRKMRAWTGPLAKDVPGFDPGSFGDTANVPDDVIEDARRLMRTVDKAIADGTVLGYIDAFKADFEPAIDAAEAEWGGAGTTRAEEADLTRRIREAGATFQAELVAFRRTLRAVIGSSHPDYQKLRAQKATASDNDDDEVAANLPDPQEAELDEAIADTDAANTESDPVAEAG